MDMGKSQAEKEEGDMFSWTWRYLHAGAARAAFKSRGTAQHRAAGIFNVGMMCFSFSFNSFSRRQNFHNTELRAKKCQFNLVSDTQSVHGLRQVTYLSSI